MLLVLFFWGLMRGLCHNWDEHKIQAESLRKP